MRLLFAVALAIAAATASATSFMDVVSEEWNLWKIMYERVYESATEEKFRMKIYMENKAYIARHNHRAHRGMHSYFLKMNHFGDHLHHEFKQKMGGCYRGDLKNLTHVQDQIGGMAARVPHVLGCDVTYELHQKVAILTRSCGVVAI